MSKRFFDLQRFAVINNWYNGNTLISGTSSRDSIKNYYRSSSVTIDGGAGDDTISNEDRSESVSINGGTGNNSIQHDGDTVTITGGAGSDSLWGGDGNDTLWGNNGTDIFICKAGEGTDMVMDYDSGELLQILNANGKAAATLSKSSLSDDVLTLTVSGGGTIILNDVDSSTDFNINGTSYKISGSKLVEN